MSSTSCAARAFGRRSGASAVIAVSLSALLGGLVLGCGGPAATPKLPNYDWDACPSDCCSYGEWTARLPIEVQTGVAIPPTVFTLAANEPVIGMSGVVVTRKAGVLKVLQPFDLDPGNPVRATPGDLIYVLHPLAQGRHLLWFKGATHSDTLAAAAVEDQPRAGAFVQVIASPEVEWWLKVKNRKGLIGWTKETEKLDHVHCD